jgi:hypothetical protein
MVFNAVDWRSEWLYLSLFKSLFSVLSVRLYFKQIKSSNSAARRVLLYLVALGSMALGGFLFLNAIRKQPVFDCGFALTYFAPVTIFLLTSLAAGCVSAVFVCSDFMEPEKCQRFLPFILLNNAYELAYTCGFGSTAALLLFGGGLVENILKIILVFTYDRDRDLKLD